MDGFSSLEELYKRVKPALNSKLKDLTRLGVFYVQKADIWNYLKNNFWCKKNNLTLGEIVNDIMTVTNAELEAYVQSIIKRDKREINNENIKEGSN